LSGKKAIKYDVEVVEDRVVNDENISSILTLREIRNKIGWSLCS